MWHFSKNGELEAKFDALKNHVNLTYHVKENREQLKKHKSWAKKIYSGGIFSRGIFS